MRYGSSNMKCNGQNFLSSGTVSCSFTPLTTQKMIILKKWKKSLEISSFYICVPKIMIRWCMIPEIWCATDGQADGWTDRQKDGRTDRRMNRWTDGQKKWHIEVGAPPKKEIGEDANMIVFLYSWWDFCQLVLIK